MPALISFVPVFVVAALCALVLAYHFMTGVPPMPTKPAEAADVVALLKQACMPQQPVIYELGCGWGSLVLTLARAFPDARIKGIELSPLPYWIARYRTRNMPNVSLKRGDFRDCDITDADAVTCYLMIKSMPQLSAFLDRMLAPGAMVVAVTFLFRDRRASAVRKGKGVRGKVALYVWPAR